MESVANAALTFADNCIRFWTRAQTHMPHEGTPSERIRATIIHWCKTSGTLTRRQRPPLMFWLVMGTHLAIVFGLIFSPIYVPRRYDGWLVLLIVLIVSHWRFFGGECVFTVYEKRFFYEHYTAGQLPHHQWWQDVLPHQASITVLIFYMCCFIVLISTIFLRNLSFTGGRAKFRLEFGGGGAISAT